MSKDPINPVVHLNGTGIKTLIEGYEKAHDALDDFMLAWGEITFNARDYYPLGPEAIDQAIEERQAMARKIRDIEGYLQRIRIHLYEQQPDSES